MAGGADVRVTVKEIPKSCVWPGFCPFPPDWLQIKMCYVVSRKRIKRHLIPPSPGVLTEVCDELLALPELRVIYEVLSVCARWIACPLMLTFFTPEVGNTLSTLQKKGRLSDLAQGHPHHFGSQDNALIMTISVKTYPSNWQSHRGMSNFLYLDGQKWSSNIFSSIFILLSTSHKEAVMVGGFA